MDTAKILERFFYKVEIQPDGCWLWLGRHDKDGYALLDVRDFFGKRETRAARIIWAISNGRPVSPEKEIDHKCRVNGCVNPVHLWEVTSFENNSLLRRQRNGTLLDAPVDSKRGYSECANGHPWTAANRGITISGGYISTYCRVCKRERSRLARQS